MEFFAEIENTRLDSNGLKTLLSLENLPLLCDSIDSVLLDERENGVIYCVWGEHKITRTELKQGVRFSLNNCPNALAWSITTDTQKMHENGLENSYPVVIHCTINTEKHEEDFIESIHAFISSWVTGITAVLEKQRSVEQ